MATQTRPHLKLGAALSSAAVIAAGAPVVVPQASLPAPTALSSAAYELTTFADLLSIPADVWTNILFGSAEWGARVSNTQESGLILDPWATVCKIEVDGCRQTGLTGALYLASDALFNGTYYNYDINPETGQPFGLTPGPTVSVVNYFWEPFYIQTFGNGTSQVTVQQVNAGLSAASQYLLMATIGGCTPVEDGGGPCTPPSEVAYINGQYLAAGLEEPFPNPDELLYPNPIGQAIWAAYYGPYLVTLGWTRGLSAISRAAYGIPLAGPYIYGTIQAYLGELQTPSVEAPTLGLYYEPGLSGILQFWINVLAGVQGPPSPPTVATVTEAGEPSAASAQAAEAAPGDAVAVSGPEASADAVAPAAETPGTDVTEVAADAPAEPTAESVRATAAADSAPAQPAGDAADGAENGTETGPADNAADAADGTEVTAAPATDPRGEAEKAPRRGLRGALEKATAKVASGVERATKGAASSRKAAAAE
ncbi:MAG: hypothetical protein ACKOB8_11035 [Mycobacterium sp.]